MVNNINQNQLSQIPSESNRPQTQLSQSSRRQSTSSKIRITPKQKEVSQPVPAQQIPP